MIAAPPAPPAPPIVTLELGPKQQRILDASLSGQYKYIGAGGAIRGGKTFAVLAILLILMRLFPRSRWAVVRQDLPTLRRNTVPVIEKLRETVGGWLGEVNGSTWTYTAANGSELILFAEGATHDPELNRWKGLEVNGFVLEEGNELRRLSFTKSIERAGAWVIPPSDEQRAAMQDWAASEIRAGRGRETIDEEARALHGPAQPPPLVFVTFNPSDEWTDELFHEPWELGTLAPPFFFQQLLVTDNLFLSAEYRASLEELATIDPAAYERFVLGKRGSAVHPQQLIHPEWLKLARRPAGEPAPAIGALRMGADIARLGEDATVRAILSGHGALLSIAEQRKLDTEEVADWLIAQIEEHRIPPRNVVVDEVALGAGPYDKMRRRGYAVRGFAASRKVVKRDTGRVVGGTVLTANQAVSSFDNIWSQACWEFRERLRTGRFSLPHDLPRELTRDLTALRYEYVGERAVHVTSGSEVKDRTGISPDYAVALIMAAFEWPDPPVPSPLPPSVSLRSLR